jgi:hypothetical protein
VRLLRNLGVVSGLTMASRVLGLARDVLMASRLGAGPLTDVFYQALTIPNTFRRVLAEGAFNAAFVPLYARELEGAGQAEAERFASEALSFMASEAKRSASACPAPSRCWRRGWSTPSSPAWSRIPGWPRWARSCCRS